MALGDNFGAGGIVTLQNLIDDTTFIPALIDKLKAGAADDGLYTKKGVDEELKLKAAAADLNKLVKIDGSNATDSGVATMLGKLAGDNVVLKTSDLKTKVAEKDVVDAIVGSNDFTGAVYTKTAADTAFIKSTELKTKVAEKDVVDAIVGSNDFTGAVYTKTAADNKLALKVDVLGANATETGVEAMLAKITTAGKKVVQVKDLETKSTAEALLGAKDGAKFVLVDELGKALSGAAADYNKDGNNVTPADFLGPKGMQGPTGANGTTIPITSFAADQDFQTAVRQVVSSDYISDNPAYWDF